MFSKFHLYTHPGDNFNTKNSYPIHFMGREGMVKLSAFVKLFGKSYIYIYK